MSIIYYKHILLFIRFFSVTKQDAKINFVNGLVTLQVPLVAKQEKCLFTLKPYTENVGNFIDYLRNEDKSIEKVNLYTTGKF